MSLFNLVKKCGTPAIHVTKCSSSRHEQAALPRSIPSQFQTAFLSSHPLSSETITRGAKPNSSLNSTLTRCLRPQDSLDCASGYKHMPVKSCQVYLDYIPGSEQEYTFWTLVFCSAGLGRFSFCGGCAA